MPRPLKIRPQMTAQTGTASICPANRERLLRRVMGAALLCLAVPSGPVQGFENLTAAQSLVYDTAHLANTVAGQQIEYRYRARLRDGEVIEDRASLEITAAEEGGKRDVTLNFLTAERHLPLPDFTAFRGNPVIIAMLEHVAQSFGRETGGGVLYFRNRIRDAMAAKDARIEQLDATYGAATISATRLTFQPFSGDPYLAGNPEYTSSVFTITLSEGVPGGVIGVAVRSGDGADRGFAREISLSDL